jgi:PAS domain S-box-containing protein
MGLITAMYALTYTSVPQHPQPEWVPPLVVAIGILGIPAGLLQWWRRFHGSTTIAHLAFALDVATVTGLLGVYSFDHRRFLFALVFPVVIEAAVLFGLGGSLAAGAFMSAVYGTIEVTLVHDAEGSVPPVALRSAVLMVVATLAGTLAEVLRRDRAALRRSEARFRAATEHSTDGVVLISPDGMIEFISVGGAAILGRASEGALGRDIQEFIHPDDVGTVAESFARVLEHPGAEASNEIRARHEDGSWVWLENHASNLLHDPDVGAIVVHTRDITERKRLQDELANSLEDIHQAGEERRRLLGRIVRAQEEERARVADALHDDPIQKLTAALMRVEMVRDPGLSERERANLDQVAATVSESIVTIRRLMVELRSIPLERLGLAAALREHFDGLSTGRTSLTIVDEVSGEIDQPARLTAYRIAQEAIANALKHSEAGHLTVTLSSSEGGVRIEVQDDGKGFDPGSPSPSGHVGLTSMRERAELVGGWCRVESAPGHGTTVSFWIPSAPPAKDGSSPH